MYVAIPYEEYVDLITSQMRDCMLDCDGVDNWEWYGESHDSIIQEWCEDAGVPYDENKYRSFNAAAEAIVNKGIELGKIKVIQKGDDERNG